MANIKLTFLEITPQQFTFKIYRKLNKGERFEKNSSLKRYKLPETSEKQNFKDYTVSFDEIDNNFHEFECRSNYNSGLTCKYISRITKKSLDDQKIHFPEFKIVEKGFRDQIEFIVKQYTEGNQIIFIFPYFLKALNKYGFIVGFRFNKSLGSLFNKRIQQLSFSLDSNFKANKNYYNDKYKIIDDFIKKFFENFSFTDYQNHFLISKNFAELVPSHLEQKIFQFSGNRTAFNQFLGIRSFGVIKPTSASVKFIFVFQDRYRNFANDLFISLAGKSNPDTFSGMEKFFQLKFSKESVEKISLPNESINSIKAAFEEIRQKVKAFPVDYKPFVIYIESNSDEISTGENNPYLFLKYNLTKVSIPLQVIDHSELSKYNALKYSTSNIGLQIFAKLGGIPWKIKPKSENCLIFGIGSAHKREEDGKISKYMAYSVCLDSSGIYKSLEMLSEAESEENYLTILRENIITLLKKEEYNSYKKCVIHLPFKIKHKEIELLKEVINDNHAMEFRILKVNMDNKFFGFADHATRVPYEGDYVQLSNNEYLVWFQGLQVGVNLVRDRIANPVHVEFIRLENEPREQDYTYLQDIMNLSGANWRGFNAKVVPISVFYAQLFADYAQQFESFQNFSAKDLNANYPWFL